MKIILRHIEFWSAIIGVLVMVVVPCVLRIVGIADGINLVLSLTIAGITQLSLLWLIYQRHQTVQRKTIDQVREMLRDRILNRLAIIWLQVQRTQPSESQLKRIQETLKSIETEITYLSSDSLETWLKTYDNVTDLENTQMLRRMGNN